MFDPFIKAVVHRPDLALYVKRVLVQYLPLSQWDDSEREQGPLDPEVQEPCTAIIDYICRLRRFGAPKRGVNTALQNLWLRYLTGGWDHARLTVLLCLLPNLEELYLPRFDSPFVINTIVESVCTPHEAESALQENPAKLPDGTGSNICSAFTRLRSICTDSGEHYRGYWDPFRARYLRLPSLRAFEVFNPQATHDDRISVNEAEFWNWPALKSSAVERLSFKYCNMSPACLERCLGSILTLKEFRFVLHHSEVLTVSPLVPRVMLRALEEHKGTLEVLQVEYSDDFPKSAWRDADHNELSFGGELRSFPKLRILECGQQALLGLEYTSSLWMFDDSASPRPSSFAPNKFPKLGEILPAQIQELSISYSNEMILPELESLSNAVDEFQYPKLRKIHIDFAEEITSPTDIDLSTECILRLPLTVAFLSRKLRAGAFELCDGAKCSPLFGKTMVPQVWDWRKKRYEVEQALHSRIIDESE